ncbi:xylulokinase [Vibrio kanaloae]|uniref:Xylulose kinase n=1 Tax=Vibrio kanaloae TaxID=170673 RepID=A0A4U1ZGY7_9VIBR|nr:xylulokinase [Vibrio kanaloae]TKF34083.1 xylulokinase [Vibrio kanaloae]
MSLIAGVDCGTQGTKVVIVDSLSHKVLSECSRSHELISDTNGKREQDPSWWINALTEAFYAACVDAQIHSKQIDAIGISGQQHGLVALDSNGDTIRNVKLWCDTETASENEEILEMLGGEQASIEKLGLRVETGYTASKILWMRKHEPENYQKIHHILLPHDYLNYWLTGECVMEYGDASGTGLFDVRARKWSEEVCDLIDPSGRLISSLPSLKEAHESIGFVKGEAMGALGLRHNVVVATGGGDNMMAAIGTGNVKDGIVTLSLGTSGTIFTFTSNHIELNHPSIASFCSSSNGWLPLICTMNVTSATTQVQSIFNMDLSEFNKSLARTEIGAEGVSFLPFFNGERVPALPGAQASIHNLNMANFNSDNIVRSVIEGATFGLRYGMDLLRNAGIDVKEIRLIGGGSKSATWRQIIADTMNVEAICPVNVEAGALGAAIQAIWALSGKVDYDVVESFVTLDESSKVTPTLDNVIKTEKVYQLYLKELHKQFPILEVSK